MRPESQLRSAFLISTQPSLGIKVTGGPRVDWLACRVCDEKTDMKYVCLLSTPIDLKVQHGKKYLLMPSS